jgi:signal transduction histidine kinase
MSRSAEAWKLAPIAAGAVALLLFVFGVVIVLYGDRTYRTQKSNDVSVQAEILAATVPAALSFGDREAAQEYVSALKANPEILVAAIYNEKGSLFAAYTRSPDISPPEHMTLGPPAFKADHLTVNAPVRENGVLLGSAYVQTVTEPLIRRLARNGVIGLLATVMALVVGILALAQAALAKANADLLGRTEDLTDANDRLRTQIAGRETAEAALRQAQKMEAIGQLTGGIAHDFNNLLQVIFGSLDGLSRKPLVAGSPELRRSIEIAMSGAERGARLTRQLLAFGRVQPLAPKTFDVNALVVEMSDLLHRTIGESIVIETDLAFGLWAATADPHQLESALLNLAVNARDAMPHGGKLMISTGNVQWREEDGATPDDLRAGDYVRIAVIDDGLGMASDVLARAVEPFFTTKGVGQGSGLGLSQVYGFVKQSGGHLKINSVPLGGTSVTLYLPRGRDLVSDPVMVEERSSIAKEIEATHRTVLLVEDEGIVLFATAQSLKRLGYRVLSASHAKAALEFLNGEEEIDILLTDIVMPGQINGVELAVEASRVRPNIKILLASGYPRAALSGIDDSIIVLQKPYHDKALAETLQAVFDVA